MRALASVSPPRINPGRDRYYLMNEQKVSSVDERSRVKRFEEIFVMHLDAAHNLARWLTRDERNAEDVVQEACLRAFKFIDSFRGDNGKSWLLAIVRNTYYTWLEKNRVETLHVPFDEDTLAANGSDLAAMEHDANNCVDRVLQQEDSQRVVNRALDQLPAEFREVIVLREIEDMSYKEISAVASIPLGTVMSRLARARKLLLQHLQRVNQET